MGGRQTFKNHRKYKGEITNPLYFQHLKLTRDHIYFQDFLKKKEKTKITCTIKNSVQKYAKKKMKKDHTKFLPH